MCYARCLPRAKKEMLTEQYIREYYQIQKRQKSKLSSQINGHCAKPSSVMSLHTWFGLAEFNFSAEHFPFCLVTMPLRCNARLSRKNTAVLYIDGGSQQQ